VFFVETLVDLSKEVEAGKTPEQVVGNIAAKTPETGSVVSIDQWHLSLVDLTATRSRSSADPYIDAQGLRFQVERAGTARFLKILRKWLLSQDGNKEALGLMFAREGAAAQARARPINKTAAMLSTIEITPSRVAGFFGYFALLSFLMLPAAVAFARRKTSRWFLLSAGLLLLIGGALNWWGLLPTFSWHGYEPDWPPICVGAFLVMMLLAIFGKVSRRRRRQR